MSAAGKSGTVAAFVRFVVCGGGTGLASSAALVALTGHLSIAVANALVTVVFTLLATELHSRFTFGAGRARGRLHVQAALSALVCYLFTTGAMLALHALQSSPGVVKEQAVYLTASGIAGIARFLFLRFVVRVRVRARSNAAEVEAGIGAGVESATATRARVASAAAEVGAPAGVAVAAGESATGLAAAPVAEPEPVRVFGPLSPVFVPAPASASRSASDVVSALLSAPAFVPTASAPESAGRGSRRVIESLVILPASDGWVAPTRVAMVATA
ncbi:hypothetical protein [Embleya hyalina]|uniref:GtrA-like protein domain-containing protein n=1 Tax=Embleya hyalina TaxID=516124 RepID=A0A401YJG8_9ACTN|nr:hypothetical protein [Embleya hyalina]GCD94772.1 hypothetical protein EHYA_02441 [Embleya hyalina]